MHRFYILAGVICLGLVGVVSVVPAPGLQEQWVVRVPQEYTTIQSAIDAVREGGIVLIDSGTYRENVRVIKSLRLIGAGQDQVSLHALDEQEPAVSIDPLQSAQVYLEGFTIGDPSRQQVISLSSGIRVGGPVQLTLRQLIISGHSSGVEISIETKLAHIVLSEVLLTRNNLGVSSTLGDPHLVIQDSTIKGNEIGIIASSATGTVRLYRSTLSTNRSAAIVLTGGYFGGIMGDIQENKITNNGIGIYLGFEALIDFKMYPQLLGTIGPSVVFLSNNEITDNSTYGLAIVDPACPVDLLLRSLIFVKDRSDPITFVGIKNEFIRNGQDLCPADYPWPPGFRK